MKCYLCGSKKYHKREGKVRDNLNIEILECDEHRLEFLKEAILGKDLLDFGSGHCQFS